MTTTTRERPILFSSPMVQAILAGRKTMTRRVMKTFASPASCTGHFIKLPGDCSIETDERAIPFCPYGTRSERLWLRETFARRLDVDPTSEPQKAREYALYRADGTSLDEPHWHSYPSKWTPGIHMPRWACRIVLEITEVRVERLQAITEEDARAEGFPPAVEPSEYLPHPSTAFDRFAGLWDDLNASRGFGWASNPLVWCIGFKRIDPAADRRDAT